MSIRPFEIHVDDAVLHDLHERLTRTRTLPDAPRRPRSGMTAAYRDELLASWRALDWRAQERRLNAVPQFLAEVDGTTVHLAHRRAARADAPALLIMHGWPHTFALQLELAAALPDVHVVVPSLPGFAFSPAYPDRPVSEDELARTMHLLMTETLGYSRYLTYGEDVSANVSDLLASRHPQHVQGIIATHAHFPTRAERAELTAPDEVAFFARLAADHEADGAYGHVQATRPDTLATALNDSPAGLLVWLVEKLVEWSDAETDDPADLERLIGRDRLLTEAMIYWVTQSIGTSFRPYYEGADQPGGIAPTAVPAFVAIQRHEADYPESVARAFYRDLRGFERMPVGGHFAAAEVPEQLADHVRRFARELGLLAPA
ncbi:epoxide hydrolase N-terminal domain-containing protein [Microbacterium sp. W1N]|uniref:epoxide hydrolase family protein n=1 Tax=Microbacterium festucae TaxID=2977531 RepID=UPI0021C1D0C3|nr:epoxide hydrolase N-terminal domain-containing protein [Microbacterium festucae]MCT9820245.1 epoxide hydrolase N-terminal domain-containing protein [Microbacterium festucae]